MKRTYITALLFCLLLSGCSNIGDHIKDPVTFYYIRSQTQYFDDSAVIVSEEREASGHKGDLSYLLAIYLMGPIQEDRLSPLPPGTKLYNVSTGQEEIEIRLSDLDDVLSDSEYTLAASCLAKTCFGQTEIDRVVVVSGERTVVLTRDSIYEFDNIPEATEEIT